jgi:small subunit ribosomal protein S17
MPKRILQGTVTSTANAQTVTVSVERRFTHPVLKKTIRKSKKYRAHDGADEYKVGDVVRIIECAPKSKTKRWEVIASRSASMEWVPAQGHAADAEAAGAA